ncbi:MAG: hypothetical protein GXY42_03330 [Desulfovibrionales bacterium]|nr:hypothetical protein [Desulfovibrionales bacterium]
MKTLRVAVVHEETGHAAPPDILDTVRQAEAVLRSMGQLDWTCAQIPVGQDLDAFQDTLRRFGPHLVFNLLESFQGTSTLGAVVPALCRQAGLPFTGADECAMILAGDKSAARRIMAATDIPVPAGVDRVALLRGVFPGPGPYIVKSRFEDASLGLDADAVIDARCAGDLVQAMDLRAPAMGGACVAERYVHGREFNLALLAAPHGSVQALPLAEMVFDPGTPGPAILHYAAKWEEGSPAYAASWRRFALDQGQPMCGEMARIGLRCWEIFGLAGYARVDFRVSSAGQVFVIDVNPNPCIALDSGFVAAAGHAGLTHRDVVYRIAMAALEQAGQPWEGRHG